MKRAVLTVFVVLVSSFGITPKEAYQKALKFEKNSDFKSALYWYKKSSQLSLGITNNINKNCKKSSKKSIKEEGSIVKSIIDPRIKIEPYYINYLMPVTYNSVKHSDRKSVETKFQISFKKRLSYNFFGLDESIYAAYTQVSYWQTTEKSSPFRETNYMPELFVLFPYKKENSFLKYYRIGLLHQSNGRGGIESRSWNRLYLQGVFRYKDFIFAPRVWYRIPERKKTTPLDANGDDNPDIWNYMGYGDLKIIYPYKAQRFSLLLRNNFRTPNRGAVQFDWTFSLFRDGVFGYLQIFSGYGESLIDYNKRNNKIGIGVAISR